MPRLRWTRERPREPGWYWWRRAPGAFDEGSQVVRVYRGVLQRTAGLWALRADGRWMAVAQCGGDWFGPIPEPEEE